MTVLLILIQPLLYSWFSLLLLLFAVPVILFLSPFPREWRFRISAPIWITFFNIVVKTVFFARVHKEDHRDEASKNKISPEGLYIANHQSFGDIPLVFSKILMPPIMKKQVLYIPVLGLSAFASGAIVVDRDSKESRKRVFEISKSELTGPRRQLQYYPEGTRRKDGGEGPKPVEEIKSALIHVAFEEKIPVYPISIYGTPKIINGGLIQPFQKVGIIFHSPVAPHAFQNKENFTKACWQKVIDGYFDLKTKINV